MTSSSHVNYQTEPSRYRHWQLNVEGQFAYLIADVDENAGLRPGYTLKLNSYDLGVDIELNDALNRIRFEHPQVRTVIITSAKDRIFCSGANIFMLGSSSHAWKVNFCKFTNETRNGIEDSSKYDGIKFVAAINGTCAGGGYELALACDRIVLVDDRSSAVSLPEVPLLGVLPGTGGLTRLTDKRHVRRDLADIFCTTAEGVRGHKAKDWRLVDEIAKPAQFHERVHNIAAQLARTSDRSPDAESVPLNQISRKINEDSIQYAQVCVQIDRKLRVATLTIQSPSGDQPTAIDKVLAAGADWYPLLLARELEDAILHLRTSELDIGTWIIKTRGNPESVLKMDDLILTNRDNWFVRETIGYLRRTLNRLEVSSRSLFALVDEQSCFVGTFLELALASDRIYHLAIPDQAATAPAITVGETNFGLYPMTNGVSRLSNRYYGDLESLDMVRSRIGVALQADEACALGLVTTNPDDLDWEDEIRIAIEARVAMSPDALTGMEANLRFGGNETMLTRIFGRLSAWQNWIFQRPNAVGETGSLQVYGTGKKPKFDWDRI